MNTINSRKFWKGIKKVRLLRYICIILFAFITIVLAIVGYFESNKDLGEAIDLTKTLSPKDNIYAFLNVLDSPYLFAENDNNKLYFVWDVNNKLCIVDLTWDSVKELENAVYPIRDNMLPVRLEGRTKTITKEIKEIAINIYNSNKTEDMDELTEDNFKTKIGNVYLYVREVKNTFVFYFLAGIFLVITLIIVIAHLFMERKIKRNIDKLSPEERELIAKEIENENTLIYEKAHVFLTENYVISLGNNLDITKYEDIKWIYFTDMRQNGVITSRRINVITHDNKDHWIPIIPYGKGANNHLEIIDQIADRNTDIAVGFTPENQELFKNEKKAAKKFKKENPK